MSDSHTVREIQKLRAELADAVNRIDVLEDNVSMLAESLSKVATSHQNLLI